MNAIANRIIYAGTIDGYFDYKLGALAYRLLRVENMVLDIPNFQGNTVVNYIDREIPWIRIIEHKWFDFGRDDAGKEIANTVISCEYPLEWKPGDPFGPAFFWLCF